MRLSSQKIRDIIRVFFYDFFLSGRSNQMFIPGSMVGTGR